MRLNDDFGGIFWKVGRLTYRIIGKMGTSCTHYLAYRIFPVDKETSMYSHLVHRIFSMEIGTLKVVVLKPLCTAAHTHCLAYRIFPMVENP